MFGYAWETSQTYNVNIFGALTFIATVRRLGQDTLEVQWNEYLHFEVRLVTTSSGGLVIESADFHVI